MGGSNKDILSQLRLRAKLPKIFGIAAVLLFAATIGVIVWSVIRSRNDPDFRMQGLPASLSKDVVATIEGYERREMDGDITRYYVKADRAVSFADNHQELENIFLEVFSDDGTASDRISAQKAIYIPAENKNFKAFFAGAVGVETRDGLKVKTEQLAYTKETEIASAEEAIEFERANVKGRSFGATVKVKEKILELLKNVNIDAASESPEGVPTGENASLKAGNAVYDQAANKVELHESVSVNLVSPASGSKPGRTTELLAGRAIAYLDQAAEEERSVKRVELFDNVAIASRTGDSAPTRSSSGYALYDKGADRLELRDAVHIITVEDQKPTEVRADNAVYEQAAGKINLTGNAVVTQGTSSVSGAVIYTELNAAKKARLSEVRENAVVKQVTPERTTEVTGQFIKAVFAADQSLDEAIVTGQGSALLVPADPASYTKLSMNAERSINVDFKGEGALDRIVTQGRTNVKMDVPNNSPSAANKSLSADSITTVFTPDGKTLATAAAAGNAEMIVTPLSSADVNYKTTINAPKFDCEFFASTNDPKICTAAVKTRTVRVPTVPAQDRGSQNIRSDRLVAYFNQNSRELERFQALGNASFSELDRNAVSETMTFTGGDQTVRLRGGSPNVWDSGSRGKAPEIDWDTKNQVSELRGGVSTTYYDQGKTGGAAPFSSAGKPVYVTSQTARFDHRAETAVFSGNARGWQEKNFVRGDRLTMLQKEGRFVAEENVQSLLYEAKRKENGIESNQPIFVSAQRLDYSRNDRLLKYQNNVDIRQGRDRITGGVANIYLSESNEPSRTEVENNVVITQPNRKAVADYVRYDAGIETVFLRGDPATVEDAEQGTSRASQMTISLRDNKVVSEGPSKQNTSGRVRSVYKIKDQ